MNTYITFIDAKTQIYNTQEFTQYQNYYQGKLSENLDNIATVLSAGIHDDIKHPEIKRLLINFSFSDLTAMFVNRKFYDRLVEVNSKFKFINRATECVLCGADFANLFDVNHDLMFQSPDRVIKAQPKHWQSFPDSKYLSCRKCAGIFVDVVPNEEMMEFLYQYMYDEQDYGLNRFEASFDTKEFNDSPGAILEIGGGCIGMKKACLQKKYYSLDFDCRSNINRSIDLVDDDDIDEIKKWKIDTIVSCDCIEHVLYPNKFINTCYKILPPGGRLYLQIGQFHPAKISQQMIAIIPPEFIQVPHINSFTSFAISRSCDGKFRKLDGLTKRKGAVVLERI